MLQAYFLIKSGLDVSIYGEKDAAIRIRPWWDIDKTRSFDLVINQDSIPEMPSAVGTAYIRRIKEIAPLFFSVNQESAASNTGEHRQLVVPELVREVGGYRMLHRNLFWLRDGYVEEVYAATARRRTDIVRRWLVNRVRPEQRS